ncbi:MAG: D-3-phosphoglycerate dehydrogenase [Bacteroidia bacterium]|jgi:D-3-phosphoglycerate dehydrogenase
MNVDNGKTKCFEQNNKLKFDIEPKMSENHNVLIIDDLHPSFMEKLQTYGVVYAYMPQLKASEVDAALKGHTALVLRSKIDVSRTLMVNNPSIKLIARAGSGMDNIDVAAAQELGVTVINCGEANKDAVADQTLGILLGLSSNIVQSNREVVRGIWNRESNRGFEIKGKTVGIIGFGNTGSAFAQRLAGFDCQVLAYDKYKSDYTEGFSHVNEVGQDEVIKSSDILSFHVPLMNETRGMINASFIQKMERPFVLMNLSRGGIMNTSAVLEGLKMGKISHFGADVLENENLANLTMQQKLELSELNAMSNVIITPHIGGWSVESYERISEVLVNKFFFALNETNYI